MGGMGGGAFQQVLASSASEPIYVDDVFSTFLYTGATNSALTITNGIDLSGEGGLVWTKNKTQTDPHGFFDTERGLTKVIYSNDDSAESTDSNEFTSFNSNGYSLHQDGGTTNGNGNSYCSWTFRKCPGFFDVKKFTGNGSNSGVTVSHSLGSVPGSIWVKDLDANTDWTVYHRSGPVDSSSPPSGVPAGSLICGKLNSSDQFNRSPNIINTVTSSSFIFGTNGALNTSGNEYIAYIFAHDDQSFGDDQDEAIIKCGSYTGNGSTQAIDFGFEPQFVIVKKTDDSGDWYVFDTMRGLFVRSARGSYYLRLNTTASEDADQSLSVTNSGIDFFNINNDNYNGNGNTYIYIAIRRPMKTTDDADEVLDIKKVTGNGTEGRHIEGSSGASVTDMFITRRVNEAGEPAVIGSRFQANKTFNTNSTDGESSSPMGQNVPMPFDVMTGVKVGNDQTLNGSSKTYMHYFFARKPEIFDVITFEGTGSARTISHKLNVTPEVAIIKRRDSAGPFTFGSTAFPSGGHMFFNQSSAVANTNQTGRFVYSNWSSTDLAIGNSSNVNANNGKYIGYLFSSKSGVCKIGTYSGTGNSLDVDCGFRARFVIIKRMDAGTVWWVIDSVHGINAGNDPAWNFENNNTGTAQYDLIDTDSDGFTVEGGNVSTNQSGGTYFFMAFA